jgi:uncharacterized membrane protein
MVRLFHALALGLLGAGIVHIVVLLLVPAWSERDAWSALSQQANFYRPVRLDPPGAPPLIGSLDPLVDAVACRFDLRDGVVQVRTEGSVPFWSISVHERTGLNIYSLNDGSSPQGRFDFVVGTPVQMIALRNAMPPELENAVFIEADTAEGILVVRAFAPDETWEPSVSAWLASVECLLH